MSGAEVGDWAEAAGTDAADDQAVARLRAIGAAIAIVRTRLAAGESPDLVALRRLIAPALSHLPGMGRPSALDGSHLVLVDELTSLVDQIALERRTLRAQIQGAPRSRRAEASYRAIGRRS